MSSTALANIRRHHTLQVGLQQLDTLRVMKAWAAPLHRRIALAFSRPESRIF